jgi:hypothetical protein
LIYIIKSKKRSYKDNKKSSLKRTQREKPKDRGGEGIRVNRKIKRKRKK